jgi:phosphinothricin acetyltransferase
MNFPGSMVNKQSIRMDIHFREILEKDLGLVRDIFNHYIIHTTHNYRTVPLSIPELKKIIHPGHPRYRSFLIIESSEPCGFVYLSQFRKREAYDRTAEITVYLKPGSAGKGIGKYTLEYMEGIAREADIRVLVGIIGGENSHSISLFIKMGYRQCAHYRQVAEKFGRIMDVVVYQKILDES